MASHRLEAVLRAGEARRRFTPTAGETQGGATKAAVVPAALKPQKHSVRTDAGESARRFRRVLSSSAPDDRELDERHRRARPLELHDLSDDDLQELMEAASKGDDHEACKDVIRWCSASKRHSNVCNRAGDAVWVRMATRIFGAGAPTAVADDPKGNFYALCKREHERRLALAPANRFAQRLFGVDIDELDPERVPTFGDQHGVGDGDGDGVGDGVGDGDGDVDDDEEDFGVDGEDSDDFSNQYKDLRDKHALCHQVAAIERRLLRGDTGTPEDRVGIAIDISILVARESWWGVGVRATIASLVDEAFTCRLLRGTPSEVDAGLELLSVFSEMVDRHEDARIGYGPDTVYSMHRELVTGSDAQQATILDAWLGLLAMGDQLVRVPKHDIGELAALLVAKEINEWLIEVIPKGETVGERIRSKAALLLLNQIAVVLAQAQAQAPLDWVTSPQAAHKLRPTPPVA
jgi:hypothetical protein